jgi:antitoxin component YwqK of YwqJK toxin-antitoxin module
MRALEASERDLGKGSPFHKFYLKFQKSIRQDRLRLAYMKSLLTLPLILLSLISFPSWGETMDDLVERDGIYYKKFSDVPFTGGVEGLDQGFMREGIRVGRWILYHENGEIFGEGNYRKGKKWDLWTFHFSNGGLYKKGDFINDKEEGFFIQYSKNGQLHSKGNYKNGFKEGRWFHYTETGNLYRYESGVFKNGLKISD